MRSCESVTATATYDSGFDSEEAIAADAAVMKAFLSESLTFVVRIRDGSPGSVAGSTVAGDAAEAATGALHRDTLPRRRPHVGAASMDKSSARHLIARSRGTRTRAEEIADRRANSPRFVGMLLLASAASILPVAPTRPRFFGGKPVGSPAQLLHPHMDLAHRFWRSSLEAGDLAVDATAGNGHDTLELAVCRPPIPHPVARTALILCDRMRGAAWPPRGGRWAARRMRHPADSARCGEGAASRRVRRRRGCVGLVGARGRGGSGGALASRRA